MALFIRRPGLPAALRQAAIYRARFSPTRPFAILSCCYLFVFSFEFAHLLFSALALCRVHLLTNIKGCFIPARSCEAGGGAGHCLRVYLAIQALSPSTSQLCVSQPACIYDVACFYILGRKSDMTASSQQLFILAD